MSFEFTKDWNKHTHKQSRNILKNIYQSDDAKNAFDSDLSIRKFPELQKRTWKTDKKMMRTKFENWSIKLTKLEIDMKNYGT